MGNKTEKARPLTTEEYEGCVKHWATAYASGRHGDPHNVFAQLMGVTRNEAKRISFTYIYTNRQDWVFNHMHNERHRISVMAREIVSLKRSNGIDMTVYQLLDWVDGEVEREKQAREERKVAMKKENK